MMQHVLIHLPHCSMEIPLDIRGEILMDDRELDHELLRITDRYTDELFDFHDEVIHKNIYSRIVFDPERFRDDSDEVMAKFGRGAIYTRSIEGEVIREITADRREELIKCFYDAYHIELEKKVQRILDGYERCLIIDGHSFPQVPMPFELDKDPDRPDICIGTNEYHTPSELIDAMISFIRNRGLSVKLNSPFTGTMVPMKYYMRDKRVSSIMIEINRRLYMCEETGERTPDFYKVKRLIHELVQCLKKVTEQSCL